jgi:uncharacterized membrane protein YdbT with pleckstrin-like domain
LTRIALPVLAGDSSPEWQTLAPGARRRLFRKTTFVATAICAVPAVLWLKLAAPVLWLVIVPLAWLYATQYVRHTSWALTREALLFRRGWLTRRVSYVPRTRVQVVQQIATPFDRRNGIVGQIRIRYLPKDTAAMLCAALYASARDSTFVRNGPPQEAVQLG